MCFVFTYVLTYMDKENIFWHSQMKGIETEKKKITFSEPFRYNGWELSAEDLEEEAEDLAAEGEEEEIEEEEKEDEEVSLLALSICAFMLTHLFLV